MSVSAVPSRDDPLFEEMFRPVTKTYRSQTYAAIDPTLPKLSNRGKTAVVAGAGSGIGAACALSLAKSGVAAIALLARTESALNQTKSSIEALGLGTKLFVYAVDIAGTAAVLNQALADFAAAAGKDKEGKVDILVASAGIMPDIVSIQDAEADEWWRGFEVNVRGRFNLLRAFAPVVADGGVVVHITTAALHMAYMPGFSCYRASNSAATKMFEYFGNEHPGLRVVQVHPGLIRSPMSLKFAAGAEGLPWTDVELSGDFVNWATSSEAAFLKDRFVHVNWDVEELLQRKADVEKDPFLFTVTLKGWA
ncbi:NAD(P)-binding protein [Apiospora phragmitis]|uniref:NAD(P)-binding protein n=1 Tax=Apiospora phragmitis TaxID=2905665 RepID=A0ABR1U6J3_9PEZI